MEAPAIGLKGTWENWIKNILGAPLVGVHCLHEAFRLKRNLQISVLGHSKILVQQLKNAFVFGGKQIIDRG